MKLVTFNREMRGVPNPALVSDEVAAGCADRGELAKPAEDYPPKPAESAPRRFKPRRGLIDQTYLTKQTG